MNATIELSVTKSAALLVEVTIILMRHGFRLERSTFSDTDSMGNSRLTLHIAKGKVDLATLVERLVTINNVQAVIRTQQPDGVEAAEIGSRLGAIVSSVAAVYPNVVKPVNQFEQSIDESARLDTMLRLGKEVGSLVYSEHFAGTKSGRSMEKAMKKLVLRAVSPFVMGKVQGNQLQVGACPFCRDKSSDEASCSFLAGFIAGLLNSIPDLPNEVQVEETNCKACGDPQCTFVVTNL